MTIRLLSAFAAGVVISSIPIYSQGADEAAGGRYALALRAKQNSFRVGDEIRVVVTWKNTSDKPVLNAPALPTAEVKYQVYVESEKGDLVAETKMRRLLRTHKGKHGEETVTVWQSGILRYFQPGETMAEEIVLNKLYDLSKPGRYTVHVQGQGGAEELSKSNTLTINVTDIRSDPKK